MSVSEIKYCEDTRPQNQMNAAKEQHKDICNILQGASVILHIILLGVGSTIYNTLTLWSLSRTWVSILKELRSLPPSSMCTLWTSLLNLSIPDVLFPILLSTLIRSRFQAKPASLLIPTDCSFPFRGGGALQYSVPKWLFSLIDVGSGFYCLRSFFFFYSFCALRLLVVCLFVS